MSTFFEKAQRKAASDRHYKQAEGALTTAAAAATIFLVKVAIEHLTTRQPANRQQDNNPTSVVDRLLRGF